MDEQRLIEVDLPLKEVSEESVREKNIRHGHISTLHIWWARRPLAASRATTYTALIPAPKDRQELRKKLKFIAELSKWESSLDMGLIEQARRDIREYFKGAPKVLDCFAGGGSIPLEALRLGCETYALDYNPVAVLILKATLEYPQKYANTKVFEKAEQKTLIGGVKREGVPKLLYDVKRWGEWVLEEVKKEIGRFYPQDSDGSIPVSYIWARTIECQNPSCKAEIPLIKQLWLAKKEDKKIALKLLVDKKEKKVEFSVVQGKEIDFDPSQGTTKRAKVKCPICGAGVSDKDVKKQFQDGRAGQRMIAVALYNKNKGKIYRPATDKDLKIFNDAEKYLEKKREELYDRWGIDPVPDEPTPERRGGIGISVRIYALNTWGDLFNSRQKLALITFMEKVREAYQKMIEEGYDEDYAKVVVSYLALGLSRMADFCSSLCIWNNGLETTTHIFVGPTLLMVWNYSELNPLSSEVGSWKSMLFRRILKVIEFLSYTKNHATVIQASATSLPYPDNYFDAIITGPPYYDNIAYSHLSDFFYVWLKRILGDLYPELLATPLTPKSEEVVAYGNKEEGKRRFEELITKAFKEIHRVLKPDGIAVIIFAYKSTEAWETIINSLLKAGLVLTASWPIHTEMENRLRAKESAAMASSIYMVCRKRVGERVAYFNEIKKDIDNRIKERLEEFWEQGIRGADFFVSAIGPAVEVFGRYSKVEKHSGEEVSVKELLEYVRKVVSEFAIGRVLARPDLGGVDAETRFYLLWRWAFGNSRVHFDEAIKLSRPMGVELVELWKNGGFVKKEKEFVKVLNHRERANDSSFMNRFSSTMESFMKNGSTSMIDVLHYALVLWEKGDKTKIKEVLNETGYSLNEVFWHVAQAISEILPEGDKEKQILQGFLYGKETYIREPSDITKLDDYMR